MLTWTVVALLAVGVYGQRALGAIAFDTDRLDHRIQRVLTALPLAIISAVVALQAVTSNRSLEIDARLGGLAVAAFCAWRRLPLLVTVLGAATTTATLRAIW